LNRRDAEGRILGFRFRFQNQRDLSF